MKKLKSFLKCIDAISEWSGKGASYMILPGILILSWEVVSRYVFNNPTMWAHGTSQRIFATYYILAGAYVLRHNQHVTVDIIYNRFSLRKKAILSLIGSIFFFSFCGVLLWKGIDFAWTSLSQLEPDETPWRAPLYPFKMMIPLGAFLILMQGLAKFIRDLATAITGREEL
ncbi:MAG: TRAP transporter small permease subunit [Deltaproteobacteria bacterium]|nr:TRAP transporter small permease subunit [Deltaproteobacteria bacterium]